ncbi:MAG: hypothetical protein QME73_07520 [Bacillota bacterium]|nr:hypothetical protein [Bacillota bacterium]
MDGCILLSKKGAEKDFKIEWNATRNLIAGKSLPIRGAIKSINRLLLEVRASVWAVLKTGQEEGALTVKKLLSFLTVAVLALSLAACSSNVGKNSNTIYEAQLTDREKMFLSIVNNKYFVFDFNVDENYKWVEIWVDRYEFGEKASVRSKLGTGLAMNEKGMLVITVNDADRMKSNWTITVESGGGTSTGRFAEEYIADEDASFSSVSGTRSSKSISIDDYEIVLAGICYKNQNAGSSMGFLTDEFFNDPDRNLREIENYDLVYLVKCKFYRNSPSQ